MKVGVVLFYFLYPDCNALVVNWRQDAPDGHLQPSCGELRIRPVNWHNFKYRLFVLINAGYL
jgi:hypothetical protein